MAARPTSAPGSDSPEVRDGDGIQGPHGHCLTWVETMRFSSQLFCIPAYVQQINEEHAEPKSIQTQASTKYQMFKVPVIFILDQLP